jgi:hypothetical protein
MAGSEFDNLGCSPPTATSLRGRIIRIVTFPGRISRPFLLPSVGTGFATPWARSQPVPRGVAIMEPELKCEQCGRPITILRCGQVCQNERSIPDKTAARPAAKNKRKLSSEEIAIALWRAGKAQSLIGAICSDALVELTRRGMIIHGSQPPQLTKLGNLAFKRMQHGREVPELDPRSSPTISPSITRRRRKS